LVPAAAFPLPDLLPADENLRALLGSDASVAVRRVEAADGLALEPAVEQCAEKSVAQAPGALAQVARSRLAPLTAEP